MGEGVDIMPKGADRDTSPIPNILQSTDDVNTKAEPANSFVNEDGTHRQ